MYDRRMVARWMAAGALAWMVGCLEAPPDSRPADEVDAAGNVGGDAGRGSDAGVSCPSLESPGGQCALDCTNDCAGDVCTVDCTVGPGCHDIVACAPDFDCHVDCGVADICIDATINCPAFHECVVRCDGDDACMNTVINCVGGPCTVVCDGDPQSCRDANLNCGSGPCAAECPVEQTAPPHVNCDLSCDCSAC